MKFLDDLNLKPDSKLVLIIAWKFKAAAQCEFSKDEFVRGMMEIGYELRIRIILTTVGQLRLETTISRFWKSSHPRHNIGKLPQMCSCRGHLCIELQSAYGSSLSCESSISQLRTLRCVNRVRQRP